MAFSKRDPLHDFLTLHERLTRLASADAPGWSPAVDLFETAERFVISAELPGLGRDDISIDIQHNTLVLRGVRPHRELPEAKYHRVERGHGAFSRVFALPTPVDVNAVSAEFSDGVLTVVIPKSFPQQHRIDVS